MFAVFYILFKGGKNRFQILKSHVFSDILIDHILGNKEGLIYFWPSKFGAKVTICSICFSVPTKFFISCYFLLLCIGHWSSCDNNWSRCFQAKLHHRESISIGEFLVLPTSPSMSRLVLEIPAVLLFAFSK